MKLDCLVYKLLFASFLVCALSLQSIERYKLKRIGNPQLKCRTDGDIEEESKGNKNYGINRQTDSCVNLISDTSSNEISQNIAVSRKLARFLRTIAVSSFLFPIYTQKSQALIPRGSFEMDMDYYFKNLIGQSPGQTTNKPIYKSPRIISKRVAEKIFSIALESISNMSESSKSAVLESTKRLIDLSLPYFQTFLPIKSYDFSDQYYLDIAMFNLYLYASNLIKESARRVQLRMAVAENVLNTIVLPEVKLETNESLVREYAMPIISVNIQKILEYFQMIGFISGYEYDAEDAADVIYAKESFDQGLPVSIQFTEKEPVLLISFIELAMRNTLFHPELIGSVISKYIQSQGFAVTFDDYLMDNFYREENFSVQAQDIIIEMMIKPK